MIAGGNQATLNWERPTYPGDPVVDMYSVFVYTYPAIGYVGNWNVCGNCLSAVVGPGAPLTNGVQYIANVFSHNSVGYGGYGQSAVFTPAGQPNAPGNVVATGGNATATIRWTPSQTPGIDFYLISASNAVGVTNNYMTVPVGTTFLNYTEPIINGAGYTFAVWPHSPGGGYGAYAISNLIVPGPTDPMTGAGERSKFSFDSFSLNDRTSASVNIGTGNLMVSVTDLSIPGVSGSIPIGRVYNSLSSPHGAPGVSSWYSPIYGYQWRSNQTPDARLVTKANGTVELHSPSGNVSVFTAPAVSTGIWGDPVGIHADLTKQGSGSTSNYKLIDHASQQTTDFNAAGDVTSVKDRFGNTVNYPIVPKPVTIIGTAGAAGGNQVTFDYTGPGGKAKSVTRPASSNAAASTVEFGYDSIGMGLISVKDPEQGVTLYGYDRVANLVEINAPDGRIMNFTYDAKHRVTSVVQKLAGLADIVTKYNYSTPGHTTVTDPRNNPAVDYEIDGSGRVTKVTDAFGRINITQWDNNALFPTEDMVTNTFNGRSKETKNEYRDNGGESLSWSKDPAGVETDLSYTYTDLARKNLPTGMTNAGPMSKANSWTNYGHSSTNGRVQSAVNSSNLAGTVITDNSDGTVAMSTLPKFAVIAVPPVAQNGAKSTNYSYVNKLLTGIDHPGNTIGNQSFVHDGAGRVRTSTTGAGVTTTFSYDRIDRVKLMTFSDGTPQIAMNYDGSGNLTSRIEGTGGSAKTTSYVYDELNRLKSKTLPTGVILSYVYDAASNMTSAKVQQSAGDLFPVITGYGYNKANELDRVTEPSQRIDLYAYNDLGLREHTWNGTVGGGGYNGNSFVAPTNFIIHTFQEYDDAGKLIQIKTTRGSSDADANRLSDLRYSYTVPAGSTCPDALAGKITDKRQTLKDELTGKTTSYCYDKMGHLSTAATDNGGPTYTYGWDNNSNRSSDETGNHNYNDADQLTGTGYAHDLNGNQTASPAYPSAVYNSKLQTTSITPQGGSAVPFDYSATGQAERTTHGTTAEQNGLLGLQTEVTGGQLTSYIREPGGALIYQDSPTAGQYYYYFDGQGSVIGLVDAAGNQRAKYSYDPFGAHATADGVGGTLPANPWRWNGGYLDSTGLYHFGERYYSPAIGRFLQVDPVMGGSCNGYDYACGDPINSSDLSGTCVAGVFGKGCKDVAGTYSKYLKGISTFASYASFALEFTPFAPAALGLSLLSVGTSVAAAVIDCNTSSTTTCGKAIAVAGVNAFATAVGSPAGKQAIGIANGISVKAIGRGASAVGVGSSGIVNRIDRGIVR